MKKNIFGFFSTMIKDAIFPIFCLQCNREGTLLCKECSFFFEASGVYFCPVCRAHNPGGMPCDVCKDFTVLKAHMALGVFDEATLLGQLIYAYKYNFLSSALGIFDQYIKNFVEKNQELFKEVDIITPVPLHKRRQAERGFNQAEDIAKIVGKYLGVSVQNLLTRKKATLQQAKLDRTERLKNLKNAFVLKTNIDVKNKKVLLIDDVFTTGATLGECARVLKQHGASKVSAFTLARG